MNKILIFGYGYVAGYLKNELQNFEVLGTNTNSNENGYKFSPPEFIPEINFNDFTHILISIPPNNEGDLVYKFYKDQIINVKNIKWIGYLSTTGVYGNHEGKVVNESSELKALDQRSLNRIKAENQWLSLNNEKLNINIFRLSGIYGPKRSIENIKSGDYKIIRKEGHVFSRIHVEDIVKVIALAIEKNMPNEIFNLADDEPSSSEDVYKFVLEKLNIPLPKIYNYDEIEISPMLKSFYESSKKVDNAKIKEVLGVNLKYPSFKEAYLQLIKNFQ